MGIYYQEREAAIYDFHRELLHLLDKCGFEIVHLGGDYKRADFYALSNPAQQILIAKAKWVWTRW